MFYYLFLLRNFKKITITGFQKLHEFFEYLYLFKDYNDNIFNWFMYNIKLSNKIYKTI